MRGRRRHTERVQAAEVGRNISGVCNPFRSVVPSSVHQAVVTVCVLSPTLIPIKRVLFCVRLGRLPEQKEQLDVGSKAGVNP